MAAGPQTHAGRTVEFSGTSDAKHRVFSPYQSQSKRALANNAASLGLATSEASSIFGARISVRAEQLTYMVGFVFLFGFIIWVTGFDIIRGLGGGS